MRLHMKEVKRFDFQKKPRNTWWILRPIIQIISSFMVRKRNLTVERVNMDDLKAPYLLLSNHHSFFDFAVLAKTVKPETPNYVVALDGFYDYTEWLMRGVGGICKRKFTNDISLIKSMKHSVDKLDNILVMYPEARYSIDGSKAVLPASLGKVAKFLNVPVVIFIMQGTYIAQPQWNKVTRPIPFKARLTQLLTAEEVKELPVEVINERINEAFKYDDWQYQTDIKWENTAPDRADNLNRVLYQCPHCLKEHQMVAKGSIIRCEACQKEWELTTLGKIRALNGETEYDSVPKWYAFEREMVKKEVLSGKYRFEADVMLETLPNAKKYYPQGPAKFVHSLDGFRLEGILYGKPFVQEWKALENYSCHIEYNFHKKADAIDLSVTNDSFWIYLINNKDMITKISLATEEIYNYKISQLNK